MGQPVCDFLQTVSDFFQFSLPEEVPDDERRSAESKQLTCINALGSAISCASFATATYYCPPLWSVMFFKASALTGTAVTCLGVLGVGGFVYTQARMVLVSEEQSLGTLGSVIA